DDLVIDDLIVHRDYGLSRFGGLHHLKIGAAAGDYLLLYFDGEDKLYLPVDRLNLVQRFKGPEGAEPRLDRLGGSLWAKSTERARKAIEKIKIEEIRPSSRQNPYIRFEQVKKLYRSAVNVDKLCFSYPGSGQRVLDGVSFNVEAGDRIAIIGPNGIGKTTLMKCLAG
ncbi:MAG: ATP-binding cassette domain-containing protein, partial [Burkholderiaceae bacterium]|nr:ATP-binding cassette domain-containing protein [Burkholderiaceae bacterium]